jgi:hypothetical protein
VNDSSIGLLPSREEEDMQVIKELVLERMRELYVNKKAQTIKVRDKQKKQLEVDLVNTKNALMDAESRVKELEKQLAKASFKQPIIEEEKSSIFSFTLTILLLAVLVALYAKGLLMPDRLRTWPIERVAETAKAPKPRLNISGCRPSPERPSARTDTHRNSPARCTPRG